MIQEHTRCNICRSYWFSSLIFIALYHYYSTDRSKVWLTCKTSMTWSNSIVFFHCKQLSALLDINASSYLQQSVVGYLFPSHRDRKQNRHAHYIWSGPSNATGICLFESTCKGIKESNILRYILLFTIFTVYLQRYVDVSRIWSVPSLTSHIKQNRLLLFDTQFVIFDKDIDKFC